MKTNWFLILTLTVLLQPANAQLPLYQTNKLTGAVSLLPAPPATSPTLPTVTTNTPPKSTTAMFTNVVGYAVFVSTTNTYGGIVQVSWNNPNPFTTQLDTIRVYRLEGIERILIGSHFITLNRFEEFNIVTPGIYQVYYVGGFTGETKARSPLIYVLPQPVTPVVVPVTVRSLHVSMLKVQDSVLLSWEGRTNRTYNIFFTTNIFANTEWRNIGEVNGLGVEANFLHVRPSATGFYRLFER